MKRKKLRILVTNDDGIHAPGLKILENIAREISDDVWVVAPEREQSGTGHSLTLHAPVRAIRMEEKRYHITGTPTDCVILASRAILPEGKKFDLLLSGVNRGWNVAEDVTYSGTIAAAMEGTLVGIPSIAFSQAFSFKANAEPRWDVAEKHGADLIRSILDAGVAPNTLINVNFPDRAVSRVKAPTVCPQGVRPISGRIAERRDPRGRPYYWIEFQDRDKHLPPGSDVAKLHAGHITLTPICLDMTNYTMLETMRTRFA